jgi:hypothetical protein
VLIETLDPMLGLIIRSEHKISIFAQSCGDPTYRALANWYAQSDTVITLAPRDLYG